MEDAFNRGMDRYAGYSVQRVQGLGKVLTSGSDGESVLPGGVARAVDAKVEVVPAGVVPRLTRSAQIKVGLRMNDKES